MAVGLKHVAEAVGVSLSTVSRALHRPEMVDEATRNHILREVHKLGYVPQGIGRALVSRQTQSIGAVVPRIGVSVFAQTMESLRNRLGQHNYTLLFAQPRLADGANIDPLRSLIERGVDGVVLLVNEIPDPWLNIIAANDLPYVTVWTDQTRAAPGAVGFDNCLGGQRAAEHLLSLGHRQFAFISGRTDENYRAHRRAEGVIGTIQNAGFTIAHNLIVETDYGFSEGHEAAHRLLSCGQPFTALICGNDYLALGAIAALREAGLAIPEAVSVLGFNDSEFAPFLYPPLTTVRFPSAEIGELAADTLVEMLEHPQEGRPPAQMLPTPLICRGSTGPAP